MNLNFVEQMLEFFPSTRAAYNEHIEKYGEVRETVVIEDIFMPEVIRLLDKDEEAWLLEQIFDYFEKVSNSGNSILINIFSVTVLENLGNDKVILDNARKYMGPKTTELQIEADRSLGRNVT